MSFLDEMLEGRLPADPLLRAEPFFWLQRLYLGQLFPALFSAARKDFPSSGSPRTGKKAMLVTTFSFGRLVCSFHEARIIVKFVCNIQRFVLAQKTFSAFLKFFCLPVDKNLFCCRMAPLVFYVRFCFRSGRLFWLVFVCGKLVYKLFITFNHF